MQTVLLVIYLMVVLALIGVVLIQRSEGGGLGIGGGSGFMSARGTANALTRTTAILATLFFVLALGMGILSKYQAKPTDILDRIPQGAGQNGVLDQLGGQKGTAPATNGTTAPAAPATNGAAAPAAPAANGAAAPAANGAAAPATPAAPAPEPNKTGVPTGQ